MIQDVWIVLHGSSGQLSPVDYLYLVFLYLLAFAALAVVTRLTISAFVAMTAESATQSNTEKQER